MAFFPFADLIERFIRAWKEKPIHHRVWYILFCTPAFVAGMVNRHNWILSLRLLVVTLIIWAVGVPIMVYLDRRKKNIGLH